MSTLILRPNADGSTLDWTCSSGSTHYTLIDESSPDDSDYIYKTVGSATDYFTFPDHSTETGVITNIILHGRFNHNNTAPPEAPTWTMVLGVVISSTEYKYGITGVPNTWSNQSKTLTTNPATGLAWTWSDIDNLVGLVYFSSGELSITGYCSQFYIEVTYITPPTIDSFVADPESLVLDSPVNLTWTTTDATSASISPTVGSTTVDGTIDLYPTVTTTYTLTATNVSGSAQSTVTVAILEPTIDSFTADPENMEFGKSSLLAWGTTGAATVTLSQGIGIVGQDGTKIVHPVETTSYTLSAANSSGTVYDYVTVTVIPTSNKISVMDVANAHPDYGRLPQMSKGKPYLEFSSDLTEHYVRSLGFSFTGGDFKRPYLSENYNSMTYLFDDTPSEVSNSIKETQLSKIRGNAPDRNDAYFDFSQTLASKENFNAYAVENYRIMGKTPPTPSLRFSGAVESIFSDVDTNIPSGNKANLSVVSPRYSGDKYIWTGRVKDGTGDWGSFSRSTGLTTIYYTPTLTSNYRYVIISLLSGGKTLAELEFMVWFKG